MTTDIFDRHVREPVFYVADGPRAGEFMRLLDQLTDTVAEIETRYLNSVPVTPEQVDHDFMTLDRRIRALEYFRDTAAWSDVWAITTGEDT